MIESSASLQPVLIGGLLVWAGAVKLRGLGTPAQVSRNAISRLVGDRWASPAWRTVGGLELVIAAALLLPPVHPAEPAAAALLAVGFLGFLGYAKLAAPDAGCGCLSAKLAPVSWRSFARAGLLLAAAVHSTLFATTWWPATLAGSPVVSVPLLLVGAAVFCAMSPELDRYWLIPLRRWKVRLTHPLGHTGSATVPLLATLQLLQASPAYRQVGSIVTSDPLDSWDEGEWRILEYAVRPDGRPATAVFAVPLHGDDPDAVRVALIDESREDPVTAGA
ncbi:MAG: MauE/DoxX family redox-associated membrane protein [Micromonosporaceae bacterium]